MATEPNALRNAGAADEPVWPPRGEMKVLAHELVRVDARDKVTGKAKYTHDVRVEGMVYGRMLLSPFPSLKITKLDIAPALAVPGVVGAIVLQGDETSWLGEPIAAVAATTPARAEDGLRAIVLEYEKRPWAIDVPQASAPNAPQIWDEVDMRKGTKTRGDEGDAKKKLSSAAAVIEATYSVPVQHHVCLETHGAVVDFKGGDEATVWNSTQATFSFAPDAAEELGLKAKNVTGRVEYMGGGFGSKFGLDVPGMAACKLAKQIGRPVHMMLTRADEFLAAGNRNGASATIQLGGSSDGKLVGMVADRKKFAGMDGSGLAGDDPYIYSVEKFWSRTATVPLNMDSTRAMRAPGHPPAGFFIESAIDELAYKLGLDPLEVRKKNLKDPVYARQLDRIAREIGWDAHPNKTKPGDPKAARCIGIGFAIATWGGGGRGGTECEVRIERDGSVSASVGTQDLGTGTRTLVAAITAEELGLELGDVTPHIGSTKLGSAGGSGGSVTTGSLSPPVKDAAFNARTALAEHVAPTLAIPAERVRFAGGRVFDANDAKKSLTWKQVCATLPAEGLSAQGKWRKSLQDSGVHGAQAARVEVDTQTGAIKVLDMIGIQDCGLPINRAGARSQVNGGMIQALSYGLFEERVVDAKLGMFLNPSLEDYKIAASMEIPRMVSILDDDDTRTAPIGMAEATIIPGHSAIANAVFNACGARVRDLPMTADKVLKALGKVV